MKKLSRIDETGNRIYDGVIFVYIQVERFSGLEATITAELEVETNNGKIISRSRDLLTSYLPGTEIKYDENKAVNEGYLIQKGTSLLMTEIVEEYLENKEMYHDILKKKDNGN